MNLAEFSKRAWRFSGSLALHALDGFKRASRRTIDERLQICSHCPDGKFDGTACTECGCNCNAEHKFLNKLAWSSESCPLGHWPAGEAAPPPRLTVGMACYRNFSQVWATCRSLALHHRDVEGLEILVVDNCPEFPARPAGYHGPHTCSERLRHYLAQLPGGKYVPWGEIQGTAAPRDQVFRQAAGDVVICVDSHVQIPPGALRKTVDWLDAHPEFRGLFHGPMLMDNDDPVTHMEPVWRGAMFGTWATARNHAAETLEARAERIRQFDPAWLSSTWNGFAAETEYEGPDQEPFAITMHGLGLFGCRRSDWLGFNPAFLEFGGEEGYIHAKYWHANRGVKLFPWLHWAHEFSDTTAAYPASLHARIRNYILGWDELGLELRPIHDHFFPGQNPDENRTWLKLCWEASQLKGTPTSTLEPVA